MSGARTASAVLFCVLYSGAIDAPAAAASQPQRVWVAVTDAKGAPVRGLGAGDFLVTVGSQQAQIVSVVPSAEPLELVVVTEGFSRSTISEARRTLKAAVTAAATAHPDSRIGLLLGDGATAPVMRSATADVAELDREIARFFETSPTTSLLDSILVASQTLSAATSPRRAILVLSIGNTSDPTSALKVARAVQQAGASVWAIDGSSSRELGSAEGRVLADVTRASGGRQMTASLPGMPAQVQQVLAQIGAQYQVSFEGPAQGASPLVAVRRAGLTVLAPGWPANVANR